MTAVKLKGVFPNPDVTIASSITYWPFGPASTWTWGNTGSYSRSFDSDGRLTGFPLASVTKSIRYDTASRITALTESNTAKSFAYGYDAIDRLTGSTVGTGGSISLNQTWALDANGNRTSHVNGGATFTYTNPSTSNKTSAVSGIRSYTYDTAGNITSDGINTLAYDDRGRLKSFGLVNYKVNGLGQRVQKDNAGTKTRFVYNESGNLIGEYDGSDASIIEHVWLNGQLVGVLKPNGGSTDIFYVYTDQIGAPRAITTNVSAPVTVWTWDNNDPFGANTANSDPDNTSILFTYNVRLPGQYFDTESGMHYNYFRDYDPAVGRYATSDPIGLKGGLNTFGYVGGMPNILSDPLGLAACKCSNITYKGYNVNLADSRNRYGHWWFDVDGKGFGWWPDPSYDNRVLFPRESLGFGNEFTGVPGALNAGEDSDPKNKYPGDWRFNPDVSTNQSCIGGDCEAKCKTAGNCLINFAKKYNGYWSVTNKSCRAFVRESMSACGLSGGEEFLMIPKQNTCSK